MAAPITVIKIGGSTLGNHDTSLDDIAALHTAGRRFVLVHGGGTTISEWLERHGIESRFVRGLRVTDAATLDVVVAVLAGLVNKRLVAELSAKGARAIGLSGVDAAVLRARRYDPELGFVGEVTKVDGVGITAVVESGAIAVLAPIAVEVTGERLQPQLLNVNADTAAGQIAAALPAERLVFLTDVAGVMDASGAVRATLTPAEARELIDGQVAKGGMIPKLEAALVADSAGVATLIADGRKVGTLQALLGVDEAERGIATRIG